MISLQTVMFHIPRCTCYEQTQLSMCVIQSKTICLTGTAKGELSPVDSSYLPIYIEVFYLHRVSHIW